MPHCLPRRLVCPTFPLTSISVLILIAAALVAAWPTSGFVGKTRHATKETHRLTLRPAERLRLGRRLEAVHRTAEGGRLNFIKQENFYSSESDFSLQQKLSQAISDGGIDDQFGVAVAISGNTAVIGAYNADVGANMGQGAVYVFTRSGEVWSQPLKLTAGDGSAGDGFGVSVSIDGDILVVGSYADETASESDHADRGAAYIFVRSGDNWQQQQKLTGLDSAGGDLFGFTVAVNNDTALIGAPLCDGLASDTGSAYVFTRSGTTWTQQQKLLASDGAEGDSFGVAVAIEANTAVVGALRHDVALNNNQGATYVFNRSGSSWSQQQKLLAEDGTPNDQFGASVGISGDSIIVGANFKDHATNLGQGAAYIFARSGNAWPQQQKLVAADGAFADAFGTSVAISANTALVGSSDDDLTVPNQGTVYSFTRNGAIWTQEQNLSANDGAENDFLGSYVAIDGTTIIAGAPQGNIGANNDQGAVYIFNAASSVVRINDVSVNEANAGTTVATFIVSLNLASDQVVTVDYATADGTARAGSDYVAASGEITFAPGQVTQPISINVNGDVHTEPDETFFLNLSSATNATIDDNQAQATIVNDDPTPAIFEFSQTNFNHNESNQSVTIIVRRSGNPVRATSIDFKTNSDLTFIECSVVNGQATQRCDYLLTAGTLFFGANELEKSFTIVTFNDAFAEGSETFSIELNNPGAGAVVGALSTTTVSIADDDLAPPTTNPVDSTRYFVRQNYYDFLQRVPDQGGEDYWVSQIDQVCAAGDTVCINRHRVGVSAAFFVSSEFTRSGGYVYRLYKAAFGEQTLYRPLYSQFSLDRARVVDGADLEQGKLELANLFVERNEFTSRYAPTLTPAQFVDAILQTVQVGSGVTFNATDRQNFIDDVTSGGRGLMLKNLGDNPAFTQAVFNRAFILMQYFGYLRRDPDQGGYEFWLGILNASPQSFEAMVCAFITSPEYQRRFSPVVTRTDASCQ